MKFSINQPQNHFEFSLSTPSRIKCSLDKTWVEQDFREPIIYPDFAIFKRKTGWVINSEHQDMSSLLDDLINEISDQTLIKEIFWEKYNDLVKNQSNFKPAKYLKSTINSNQFEYIYGDNQIRPLLLIKYSLLNKEKDWETSDDLFYIDNYATGKELEQFLIQEVQQKFKNYKFKVATLNLILGYEGKVTYFSSCLNQYSFYLKKTRLVLVFNIFQIWRRLTFAKLKSGLKVNHKHPQSLINAVCSLENESVIKRLQGSKYIDGEWELVDPNKAYEVWRFPIFTPEQIQSFKDRAYELKRLRS